MPQTNQTNTQGTWLDLVKPAYDKAGKANYLDDKGNIVEGIYSDLENEVYHALPAHSSSGIKAYAKGKHHYYRQYLSDITRKRSVAQERTFDAGTHAHSLILEPHTFYGNFVRMPCIDDFSDLTLLHTAQDIKDRLKAIGQPTSGSKDVLTKRLLAAEPNAPIFDVLRDNALLDKLKQITPRIYQTEDDLKLLASNLGITKTTKDIAELESLILEKDPNAPTFNALVKKHAIDHIVWDDAFRVLETTRAHPTANWLFSDGLPELSAFARCPTSGLLLKIRFDWMRFDGVAVDMKTTLSTNPYKFKRQMEDLRYDLQESFYTYVGNLAGIPVKAFAFVATEYVNADNCEIFELSQKRKMESTQELMELLPNFKTSLDTDNWYGHSNSRSTWVIE